VLAARTGGPIDALPDSVEALITSQIDRLPRDERLLLRVASVLGVGFQESELRTLLRGESLPTRRSSLRNLGYFIKAEGHGRFRFEHQLIRDTAYEGLPFRLRKDLHGRAGEMLEANAADVDDVAELLSLHFFHANRADKAWHYSRVAGERATNKYAFVQAEELLARAVQMARGVPGLADREVAEVQLALGEARYRIGRNELAIAAFRAARSYLKSDPVGSGLAVKREAQIQDRLGRHSLALRTISRGLASLPESDDPQIAAVRSRLEGGYAIVRLAQGRFSEALRWARAAEAHAEVSGDPAARADSLLAIHDAMSFLGVERDQPYGEQALEIYESLGDRVNQVRALNNLAMAAWVAGEGLAALRMYQRAAELADEAGDTVQAAATRFNIADVLVLIGRTGEAEQQLLALIPELERVGLVDFVGGARRALGMALAVNGDPDRGREVLESARADFVTHGESGEVLETDTALVLARNAAGDFSGAAALAAEVAERARATGAAYLLPRILRLLGVALAGLGRPAEAVTVTTYPSHAYGVRISQGGPIRPPNRQTRWSEAEPHWIVDRKLAAGCGRGEECPRSACSHTSDLGKSS